MNFSQKLVLFILIVISAAFVYFTTFGKELKLPDFNIKPADNGSEYNPLDNNSPKTPEKEEAKNTKNIKIYVLDKSGHLYPLRRTCDLTKESSCFEFAIKELIKAPTKWEKSKGFTSEIPAGTKLRSIRQTSGNILIDLSSDFETGGGAESTYMRVKQIVKTANSNTSSPVYLYINGRQANVIGGEGIMLKQPLNERSLDE